MASALPPCGTVFRHRSPFSGTDYHLHAELTVFRQHSPSSCSVHRLQAALTVFMQHSPSSCSVHRLQASLTVFMQRSPSSCSTYHLHAAFTFFMQRSPSSGSAHRLQAALTVFRQRSPSCQQTLLFLNWEFLTDESQKMEQIRKQMGSHYHSPHSLQNSSIIGQSLLVINLIYTLPLSLLHCVS